MSFSGDVGRLHCVHGKTSKLHASVEGLSMTLAWTAA